MTAKLVWENLKHRPLRSLLSFLLIGVPVTLILTLVGLTHGMIQDFQERQRGSGADIMVRGTNAATALSFSSASLLEGFVNFFQKQPHVRVATGILNHSYETFLTITGIDLAQFDEMTGGFKYLEGGRFQQPDDVIIDHYFAAERHLQVGRPIMLLNRSWRVCGIIEGGHLSHIFVQLKVLQDLDSATGKVSQILLKLDSAANTQTVIQALKDQMPEYPIYSMEEFTSLVSVNNVAGLREFTWVVVGLGVVIGAVVVWMSMYMAVLMRTREIGILKSLGGSDSFILGIVVLEALLLGAGGTVLGILMSFGAQWLIRALVPASIQMAIVPVWWPIALGIMLASAALGAIYPGLSAARHDPIEALAYE
ncbi:MAG: ABC transporter permease [Acidobacteriia bacterium]|nr:ABC transporter permease [Terriglobia bacterium]